MKFRLARIEDLKQLKIIYKEIISAFALCDNNAGEASVEWSEKSAKAMYIDRLGVNVAYSKKGIAQQMLNKAKEISKSIGAEYLRLFVVDINKPAIRLYQKTGYSVVSKNRFYKS